MSKTPSSIWPTNVRNSLYDVACTCARLRCLTNALYETGQGTLASKLDTMYDELIQAHDQIDQAVNAQVDASYKAAQDATGSILKACLAGAELAKH